MKTTMKATWFAALTAALAIPAAAQEEEETNRHGMTFSLSPFSPGVVGGTYSAAELIVTNSGVSPDGSLWGATELGIPPATFALMNIDAASDGTDYIPCDGASSCREILYEVTVTTGTTGAPGSDVWDERHSDGAASDVFGTVVRKSSSGADIYHYRTTDALGTDLTSDLDALVWGEEVEGVIYFSVDPATATLLSGGLIVISPADILAADASGWHVWLTEAQLGLAPGDDIDALSVDIQHGCIGFSLTPTSPTIVANPMYGPADILASGGTGGVLGVHATAKKLGLEGVSDDVNGVRITDPWRKPCRDSQLKMGGFPYEALTVNGTGGNVRHLVRVKCGAPLKFGVKPFHPSASGILLWTLGRPCDGQITPFAEANDCLVLDPALVMPTPVLMVIPPGGFTVTVPTAQLPCPLTVTLQAAFSGPPKIHLSNAVTVRLH